MKILKGSTSLDLHYLMRVASDIGARSLMVDLETAALELGGSSFKAPEKLGFPCHVEAWEHFAAIYNPSVSSFQDWHTIKKNEKKLKYSIHFVSFAGIVAFQKGTCTEGEVEGETKGTFTLAANSPCSRNERQCFILTISTSNRFD